MAKTDEDRYRDVIIAGLEILSLRKEIEDRIKTIKTNITMAEYENLDFNRGALNRIAKEAIGVAGYYHVILPKWFVEDGYCRNLGSWPNDVTASSYNISEFSSFIFTENLLKEIFGKK